MGEMKPCPFCGGEAHVSTTMDEDIWSHNTVPYTKVECGECQVGTGFVCQGWEPTAGTTRARRITAWTAPATRRHPPQGADYRWRNGGAPWLN